MRHRTVFSHGKVRSYDPQSHEKHSSRNLIEDILQTQGIKNPISHPINIKAIFYMGVPESWSQVKKREAKWWHEHTKKPDLDNLMKYLLDNLNGLLFQDDCQIVQILAMKRFGNPRTEVEVSLAEDVKPDIKSSKILSLFGEDEIREFQDDIWELFEIHSDNAFDELDLLGDIEGLANLRRSVMEKSAKILAYISKKWSKPLSKIAKLEESNVVEFPKPKS